MSEFVRWRIQFYVPPDNETLLVFDSLEGRQPEDFPADGRAALIAQNAKDSLAPSYWQGEDRYQWLIAEEQWIGTDTEEAERRIEEGTVSVTIRGDAIADAKFDAAFAAGRSDQDFAMAGPSKEEIDEMIANQQSIDSIQQLFSLEVEATKLGYYNKETIETMLDTRRKVLIATGMIVG